MISCAPSGEWVPCTGLLCHAKYLQQTRRIKQAMVDMLPKKRYPGQLFERSTNDAFLLFVEAAAACPGEEEIARDIDTAIAQPGQPFSPTSWSMLPVYS